MAGGKKRQTSNWIDGVFLSRTDTSDGSLGVEAQLFDQKSSWFASYVRSYVSSETIDSENFVVDRGSLHHNRELPYGLSLHGNLSWQSTRREILPSSEQFFIGGEGSVRGYPVGIYGGDSGQAINLELHHPLLTASEATNGVGATGFFFADYGRVKPFRAPNSHLDEYDELTGVGWGVHSALGKNVYAAQTGSKPFIATFKSLGVAIKDSAGNALPLTSILWKVRDAISQMGAGSQRRRACAMGSTVGRLNT